MYLDAAGQITTKGWAIVCGTTASKANNLQASKATPAETSAVQTNQDVGITVLTSSRPDNSWCEALRPAQQ